MPSSRPNESPSDRSVQPVRRRKAPVPCRFAYLLSDLPVDAGGRLCPDPTLESWIREVAASLGRG